MKRKIALKAGCGEEAIVGVYPLECLRTNLKSERVTETIQCLYITRVNKDKMQVGVYPGITGYESFYLDDILGCLVRNEAAFVPKKTIFGMSKFVNEKLVWCAGTPGRWDQLTCTVGDFLEAIEEIKSKMKL